GSHPALAVVTLLDSGALLDPVVGGVHHRRQVAVGHHLGRDVTADAGDPRVAHAPSLPPHTRSTAAPQLAPAPHAARQTRAPRPMRPLACASLNATGSVAAVRCPCAAPASIQASAARPSAAAHCAVTPGSTLLRMKASTCARLTFACAQASRT